MRTPKLYAAIRAATIGTAERQQRFRLCHLSIQNSHIHLLVEADDKLELARGMRSFEVSIAKRINRLLRRCGKVFVDRYPQALAHEHVRWNT